MNNEQPAPSGVKRGRPANDFNENGLKACSKCKQLKTKKEYYKSSSMASGYASRCIPCQRKATKSSIEINGRPPRDRSKYPVVGGEKYCPGCTELKSIDSFEFIKHWGYRTKCRECDIISKEDYAQRQRNLMNGLYDPQAKREYYLVRNYGITLDDYNLMFENQGGVCAICGCKPEDSKNRILHVDHCHKTGKVRGLLCSTCNITIGKFDDDPRRLIEAAKYLLAHDERV